MAGGLNRRRAELLAVGTAPMGDENTDGVAARRRACPEDLRRQLQLIDVGPAGAVENVEELYEAGLPEGLPGGLALVAIKDRETLLAKVRRAHAAKAALLAKQGVGETKPKAQGATRKAGVHDRQPRSGRVHMMMAIVADA